MVQNNNTTSSGQKGMMQFQLRNALKTKSKL